MPRQGCCFGDLPVRNPATSFVSNLYAPSADGQRFLVSRLVADDADSISVILNWTAALKR